MNLYKCRRCKGAWAMETRAEKFWCPMCGNYVTDMSPYIEPDPQPDGGEIVRLAEKELKGTYLLEETKKRIANIVRAIEAKIEAVRENHQEQIDKLGLEIEASDAAFRRESGSNLDSAIKGLERKVKSLEKGNLDFHRTMDDRISRLEDRHQPSRAQAPDEPVAYAWDKDHKVRHPLIPGVSVLGANYLSESDRALFIRLLNSPMDSGADLDCIWLYSGSGAQGTQTCWDSRDCTWLFDLPFPGGDQ